MKSEEASVLHSTIFSLKRRRRNPVHPSFSLFQNFFLSLFQNFPNLWKGGNFRNSSWWVRLALRSILPFVPKVYMMGMISSPNMMIKVPSITHMRINLRRKYILSLVSFRTGTDSTCSILVEITLDKNLSFEGNRRKDLYALLALITDKLTWK